MNKLLGAAIVLTTLLGFGVGTAPANEFDQVIHRPIDNWLGHLFDHSYSIYHWDGSSSWYCNESFGGDCSCDGSSSCYVVDQGDESYGNLWAYQCGQWVAGRTYGVWGVCHQASANIDWYVTGGSGNMSSVRGWSWSVAAYGAFGTDGGAGCT